MIYKLLNTAYGQSVFIQETNTVIPFSPDNTDYQEYLKWVAEGNEPLPADE